MIMHDIKEEILYTYIDLSDHTSSVHCSVFYATNKM